MAALESAANKILDAVRKVYRNENAVQVVGETVQQCKAEVKAKQGLPTEEAVIHQMHAVVELAIRKFAEELLWKMQEENISVSEAGVNSLLDLSIETALKGLSKTELPYMMLLDLMEGQTIKTCEDLWGVLEERKEKLTTPEFIDPPGPNRNSKSSLCLLRMCNALLRKLSKTHNTVFCGKILVFLSYTFKLSERSAVNLAGRVNSANVTSYEDEDDFFLGDDNEAAKNPTMMDIDGKNDRDPVVPGAIDYRFYKVFWGIQRFFCNPNLSVESKENWETFLQELGIVLSAFEGYAFSAEDLDRAKERRDAQMEGGMGDSTAKDDFFQPKYLTNSRLLRLQLSDPLLRECMLTQFLSLFHNILAAEDPAGFSPKQTLPPFQERVVKLLEKTPPDGKSYSKLVAHVLEREKNWLAWKAEKCPAYEKFPSQEDIEASKKRSAPSPRANGVFLPKKKFNPLDAAGEGILSKIIHNDKEPDHMKDLDDVTRGVAPVLKEFLEPFIEAFDPENGIEEEFHPKKDKMLCWRSMRLIAQSAAKHMQFSVDGIEALVKRVIEDDGADGILSNMPEGSTEEEDHGSNKEHSSNNTKKDAEATKDGIEKPVENNATAGNEPANETTSH